MKTIIWLFICLFSLNLQFLWSINPNDLKLPVLSKEKKNFEQEKEVLKFTSKYLGIVGANVDFISIPLENQGLFRFDVKVVGAEWMKKIFTVNFLLRSFVKSHDYNLIKHTTNQQVNEKSFKIEKIVNWKKKIFLYRFKDNNTNEKIYKTIYLKDDFNMGMSTTAAFYYARKLLLKKGDKIKFPIFFRDKIANAIIYYEKDILIDTVFGKKKANIVRVDADFNAILSKGTPLSITVIVSDDKYRLPLFMEIPLPIGKATMTLQSTSPVYSGYELKSNKE